MNLLHWILFFERNDILMKMIDMFFYPVEQSDLATNDEYIQFWKRFLKMNEDQPKFEKRKSLQPNQLSSTPSNSVSSFNDFDDDIDMLIAKNDHVFCNKTLNMVTHGEQSQMMTFLKTLQGEDREMDCLFLYERSPGNFYNSSTYTVEINSMYNLSQMAKAKDLLHHKGLKIQVRNLGFVIIVLQRN